MALQVSGQISMNDMNIDRGIPSATQINLATAGTAYGVSYNTIGTDDLKFSEFYGLSVPSPTPPSPPPLSITPTRVTDVSLMTKLVDDDPIVMDMVSGPSVV